jgi:hypothetical protein
MRNDFLRGSVRGLNICPDWLVTTAMAIVLSRKTAAPVLSAQGAHSDGTAIWQARFESFTTVHPAGTVCAQVGWINKKSRGKTICFLMAGFYRHRKNDTRLPLAPLPFETGQFHWAAQVRGKVGCSDSVGTMGMRTRYCQLRIITGGSFLSCPRSHDLASRQPIPVLWARFRRPAAGMFAPGAVSRQHAVVVDPLAAVRQRDPIARLARDDVEHDVWHQHRRRRPIQEANAEVAIQHQPGAQPAPDLGYPASTLPSARRSAARGCSERAPRARPLYDPR